MKKPRGWECPRLGYSMLHVDVDQIARVGMLVRALNVASLRRRAYAVIGSKLPTAGTPRPLRIHLETPTEMRCL